MSNVTTKAFLRKCSGTLGASSTINKPATTLKKYKLEPEHLSHAVSTNISKGNAGSSESSAGGAAAACA